MTLTVRLSPHLRQQLDSYCKSRRVTKTHVITELLSDHLSSVPSGGKTPYQLAREFGVMGGFSSGKGDLAENRKLYLAEKLRGKHSR
ncbi:MAG: CopG family transcriptional regulator [Betaproteobacteria bacterium]|nr:CopG family transcriptional regulator [Betaproteobacteria bacterium]